ncbi:acryloyl-CoA reductase [Paenibacillus barcinonensis]|uniref:Acryloyl-CoA reductase n=1 Tax=Paenibacillus barcinonensis TaxID=198119 RepID=A0A2V4VFJ4_PAEBA|nr:acryloyl-CoA reductase [Paenibacillus barcinonensis]PYE52112.1 putative YhdH/YhfP family quinone oxidoreductase [Paenibacillus barcinonensis]QKS59743.1 acryloyl-CoA reductase [Paenibacillus barcinonensis]
MKEQFQAYVLRQHDQEGVTASIEQLKKEDLPNGDVTVQIHYSSVNYKDGLATLEKGGVVRQYPMVPGIDLVGTVEESVSARFAPGDRVISTGFEPGVSHYGGYSEYARLQSEWLVPLPQGLSEQEAMAIGTAGFTAALSVDALIHAGISPDMGKILVTGATGGVGSMAIAILAKLGYTVTASTGKKQQEEALLRSLGASEVISREEADAPIKGAMGKQQWAAVVDPTAGPALAERLKQVQYGGAVAVSGLTGGSDFESTVFPFILRGIQLMGIDSVYCPMTKRERIWAKLGGEWKPDRALALGVREITLGQLPHTLENILRGGAVGRTVVRICSE